MTKKIEDVIKSDKFRSEYHKAALNILITSHWISWLHADVFKKYKLTPQQYNVLRILRGRSQSPCTLLYIKERMIDKMSDVSRIIERLRVAGLIDRSSCPEDRRAVNIVITDKGLKLLEIMQPEEANLDTVMKNLSLEEAKTLNDLLDKLRS